MNMSKKRLTCLSITLMIILTVYLYQVLRPTIIIHSPVETGYLGKVSKIDGCIDKLYFKNHLVKYRLPHIWNWGEEDEIAIFTRNYYELLKKENIDFWKMDVFLNEDGYYVSHSLRGYF